MYMLVCFIAFMLLPIPKSYTSTGYEDLLINLAIVPDIVERGSVIKGFVYITDREGKPVPAWEDVTVELASNSLVSLPHSVTIKEGHFYTSFELETRGTGEASVTAVYGRQISTDIVKIIDTHNSTHAKGKLMFEIRSLTSNLHMLTDSELPLILSIKDDAGRYVPAPTDLYVRLSYSTELITVEYNPYIPKDTSFTLLKVRSYNSVGIAYVTAHTDLDGENVVTSTSIYITSDGATRLNVNLLPPIVSKGFTYVDILITLMDANGVPVLADRDIVVKITSDSPALHKLDENSARSKYVIRKGEYSLISREHAIFASTGKVSVSASASGLMGGSATLTIVEPLSENSTKSKEKVLRLFLPESIANGGTMSVVYQPYAIEDDGDDCPRLDKIGTVKEEDRHVGTIDLSSVVEECDAEGYKVHNIDLLEHGEVYPISNGVARGAYVTVNDASLEVVSNNVVHNAYGVITVKGNSRSNEEVTLSVNMQGAGSTSAKVQIIGSRLPHQTLTALYEDTSSYRLFITVVEYGNRPIMTDMRYIINPLAILVEIKGSSYAEVVLEKGSIGAQGLDIVPIGVDANVALTSRVSLADDIYDDVIITLPFTTLLSINGEYRIGYVQLFKGNTIYTATKDTKIRLASSDDSVLVHDALVRKGSSFGEFTIILTNTSRERNVEITVLDKGRRSIDLSIVEREFDEPDIIAYSNGDEIEVRLYTMRNAEIVWREIDGYTYIQKDDKVVRADGRGFYAKAVLKPLSEWQQLNVDAMIVAPGYKVYSLNYTVYELLPRAEDGDGILSISVKTRDLYAGETGYIDVFVSDVMGNPVSATKINIYGSDGVEVLTNTLYTTDDGSARAFIKAVKDSTIYIEASRTGYSSASIQIPLRVTIQEHKYQDTIAVGINHYILIGTSVAGVAAILTFMMKSKRRSYADEDS